MSQLTTTTESNISVSNTENTVMITQDSARQPPKPKILRIETRCTDSLEPLKNDGVVQTSYSVRHETQSHHESSEYSKKEMQYAYRREITTSTITREN